MKFAEISRPDREIRFDELDDGYPFLYQGVVWIKLDNYCVNEDINAIRLDFIKPNIYFQSGCLIMPIIITEISYYKCR